MYFKEHFFQTLYLVHEGTLTIKSCYHISFLSLISQFKFRFLKMFFIIKIAEKNLVAIDV